MKANLYNLLPQFQSHKVVAAARLVKYEFPVMTIDVCGRQVEIEVDARLAERIEIKGDDLGVFVVYQDGHCSWSPSQAFDNGYEAIDGEAGSCDKAEPADDLKELEKLVNRLGLGAELNTPDFVLARYLLRCLAALGEGVAERDRMREGGDPVDGRALGRLPREASDGELTPGADMVVPAQHPQHPQDKPGPRLTDEEVADHFDLVDRNAVMVVDGPRSPWCLGVPYTTFVTRFIAGTDDDAQGQTEEGAEAQAQAEKDAEALVQRIKEVVTKEGGGLIAFRFRPVLQRAPGRVRSRLSLAVFPDRVRAQVHESFFDFIKEEDQ